MWKRLVRATVRQGLRPSRVRRLVQAELDEIRAASRPAAPPDPAIVGREFVDGSGRRHPLDPVLRDRLKPQWRTICDPVAIARPPTDEALVARARQAEKTVADARTLIASLTGQELAGHLLEIGCYDGAAAFQLARGPQTSVIGSDLARYYLVQQPGETVSQDLDQQQAVLAGLRERAGRVATAASGARPGAVDFVEDDITSTRLETGTFDAILSFEVVEHLADPAAAFAAIARLLKPGGLTYHDYNPFFSANGGHSLCTLDLAWGHARLAPADVERYLREIRPAEAEQALRFYRESLNRLTLAGLRQAIQAAGLELLAVLPWSDRTLVKAIDAGGTGRGPGDLPDRDGARPAGHVRDRGRPPPGRPVKVRPAGPADRDRLLAWANDPATRSAGFRVEPISPDLHERWFAARLAEPANGRIWIGLAAGRPVGVVRVDRGTDNLLVVSISLAPEERGKGQSVPLLEAGLDAARRAFPGTRFRAWIRTGNAPSIALFMRAGFRAPAVAPPRPTDAAGEFLVLECD